MKTLRYLLVSVLLCAHAVGQTPPIPFDPKPEVVPGSLQDQYVVQWDSADFNGKKYAFFLEISTDLESWIFADRILFDTDDNGVVDDFLFFLPEGEPGSSIAGPRYFFRTRFLHPPVENPLTYDIDGDGVSSFEEVRNGTNPFDASLNLDGDVFPDDWEIARYGNLDSPGDADYDGDTISDFDEFNQGTDPTSPEQLEPPVFSHLSGNYVEISVTITNPNAIGSIHYTLDGSEPTVQSPFYDPANPPTFDIGIYHVKARVFDARQVPSETEEREFTLLYSDSPSQEVYYGWVNYNFGGGFIAPTPNYLYASQTSQFIGKSINVGKGWIHNGGFSFEPDFSEPSRPLYYVATTTNGSVFNGQNYILQGFATSTSGLSSNEYLACGRGWVETERIDQPTLLSQPIYPFMEPDHTVFPSANIYMGERTFSNLPGLVFPALSTLSSHLNAGSSVLLGKGWPDIPVAIDIPPAELDINIHLKFSPDDTEADGTIYAGFVTSQSGFQNVLLYSRSTSSFSSSKKITVGQGRILSPTKMLIEDSPPLASNIIYGRKSGFPQGQFVFVDDSMNTLDGSYVDLSSGYITSATSFDPDLTQPAKTTWEGVKRFQTGGLLYGTFSYDQNDFDGTHTQMGEDGWIYGRSMHFLPESEATADDDGDGIQNAIELFVLRTDPENWDSDGDLLSDGVEAATEGFDPLRFDDPNGDLDGDGLNNITEFSLGGRPDLDDTDGDGFPDFFEYFAGTSLTDPNDNEDSEGFNRDHVVELFLTIGDHSGSHSERWGMTLVKDSDGSKVVDLVAPTFGELVERKSYRIFRSGESYTATVNWLASNNTLAADYDYTAKIEGNGIGFTEVTDGMFIAEINDTNRYILIDDDQADDPNNPGIDQSLLGVHDNAGRDFNYAEGKTAKVYLFDLDVDLRLAGRAKNQPEVDPTTGGLIPNYILPPLVPEDEQSDPTRCPVVVNNDNDDGDTIPATPYPVDNNDQTLSSGDADVVMVTLRQLSGLDLGTIEFTSSSNSDIRLFRYEEGESTLSDVVTLPLTLDLSNPNTQSPLYDILEGDISFYAEGLNGNSDLEFQFTLRNAQNAEFARSTAHMQILDARIITMSAQPHGALNSGETQIKLRSYIAIANNILRTDNDGLDAAGDVLVPVTFQISSLLPEDNSSAHSSWDVVTQGEKGDILDYLVVSDIDIYVVQSIYEAGGFARLGAGVMVVPLDNAPDSVIAHEWLHAFGDMDHICVDQHLMVNQSQDPCPNGAQMGTNVREEEKTLFLNN